MEREAELSLVRRCLERLRSGTTERGAAEHASPVERYLDPDRYAREMERLFRELPIVAACSGELTEPGTFVTAVIAGSPVLVTRQEDGSVRAFLNVCRHRGTRVVAEQRGRRARFACPYHAWTYALDGSLVRVRHEEGFPSLDRAASGLVALPCEERHGLVWITLDRARSIDVAAFLGSVLDREVAALGLDRLEPYRPERSVWAANWKLIVEGGLEAYHFKVAHAKTIAPLFTDNLYVADRFGAHFRMILVKRSMAELEGTDEASWSLREHSNLLYTLVPNSALIVQSDHVAWITFRPLGVDRTEVQISLLVPRGPRSESADQHWQKNHEITLPTLDEDFALAESIQANLASGANRALRFGLFEHLLADFHATIDELLEAPRGHPRSRARRARPRP